MERESILQKCDHTLLTVGATHADLTRFVKDAAKVGGASVCIAPCYVSLARATLDECGSNMPVCTVIGFPNGYSTTESKVFEAKRAIAEGATEIDTVINVGYLKSEPERVAQELAALREATKGYILKVIVEACLLSEAEKVSVCGIVTESGADYIKTSTGFSKGGATLEDIAVFKAHIGENVKIKAAGGIRTLAAAEEFIEAGCSRIGTSAIIKEVLQG